MLAYVAHLYLTPKFKWLWSLGWISKGMCHKEVRSHTHQQFVNCLTHRAYSKLTLSMIIHTSKKRELFMLIMNRIFI